MMIIMCRLFVSSDSVTSVMANIHSYVLSDCKQNKWAGDTAEELSLTEIKVIEKKNQLKTVQVKKPNRPYSKTLMLENIR